MSNFYEENNTISLCMIVKNEEHNIERCLESVQGSVDEIIVVDTGSTDSTIEKAKKYGAKIFNYQWNDDFSEARNFALKQATCDWIFIMDADEELDETSKPLLHQAIQYEEGVANFLFVREKIQDKFDIRIPQARLFRNYKGITYQNIVCENIFKSLKKLVLENKRAYRVYPIDINHFGFNQPDFTKKAKRNFDLINLSVEKETNQIEKTRLLLRKLNYMKIIREDLNNIPLVLQQAFNESAKITEIFLDFEDPMKIMNTEIINNLILLNNFESAGKIIESVSRYYPNSLNLLYFKYLILTKQEKTKEAEDVLLTCKRLIQSNAYDHYETNPLGVIYALAMSVNDPNAISKEELKNNSIINNERVNEDLPDIIVVDDFQID